MHIWCTTGSLQCGIFRVCSLYTHLSLHCRYVQLCDMPVSNPRVTPISNRTACVDMVNFLQKECMRVLKVIVGVKELLDKNLTNFIR